MALRKSLPFRMIHLFDIINVSNDKNLDADSGIRLKREFLGAALRREKDLFIHLLVPKGLPTWFARGLPRGRLRLIPVHLPARQRGGAFHFDPDSLSELLDLKNFEIDAILSNAPELTPALLFLLNKAHFLDVHAFTYVHWMDYSRWGSTRNRWNEAPNLSAVAGMLASHVVGCNSAYGRRRILDWAKQWLSSAAFERLQASVRVVYPGVHAREIRAARALTRRRRVKTIVFPYRAQRYTGFQVLLRNLARLYETRQDFRLVLTNPSDYNAIRKLPLRYDFIEVTPLPRREYLELLWKSDVVVGLHNGANQWSLAAVEAIACECVPLFNRESFFPEMVENCCTDSQWEGVRDDFFYYRSEFNDKLGAILDDIGRFRESVKPVARGARGFYDWGRRVDDWLDCITRTADAPDPITHRSSAAKRLVKLVQSAGEISKADLLKEVHWHPRSRQVPWTRYRNYMLDHVREVLVDGQTRYSI